MIQALGRASSKLSERDFVLDHSGASSTGQASERSLKMELMIALSPTTNSASCEHQPAGDGDRTTYWQAIDDRHHLHPFTNHPELARKRSRVITHAQGCYLWDSKGNRILDGMAGLWCVNLGYGRERLAQAAYDQMRELAYYNTFFHSTTPPVAELALALAAILPQGFSRIFFNSSGSEANDTIIKTIWYYYNLIGRPEKKVLIGRRLGYHGSGVGSGSLSGMGFMHEPFDLPMPRFEHVGDPYAFFFAEPDEDDEAFGRRAARWLEEKILALGPERVAAFFAEPIQGAGGVIIPPHTYWPAIQDICRRYDVLLVADEVICGFGRTGAWWGSTTFDIAPDMITMAKGLSSGYLPIAAVGFHDRIGDVLAAADREFAHGMTYAGHPVAARVALETIAIMHEEGLATRAAGPIGERFAEMLSGFADHPLVGEVRSCGLLGAIELVEEKAPLRRFAPCRKAGLACRDISIDCGLVMRAVRDTMVLSPPLIIEEAQIDEIGAKLAQVLDRTAELVRA